eukprot:c65_g1_i1.p1 GENE.c65_g1_i1~~c65_g1_i1.p1  ORF type:complete len:130 (+),score=27.02 c65_g1_i1:207-596(+)
MIFDTQRRFFSLLIILAELRIRIMLKNFNFLQTFLGRGLFYLFVATICFVYIGVLNVIVGIVLAVNGGLHIFLVVTNSGVYRKEKEELAEKGYVDGGVGTAVRSTVAKSTKKAVKDEIKAKVSSASADV